MPAAPETLTARRLNRALLARQNLLERASVPLTDMVERMGGIQMQYAPSGYIGLWTRLADFERDALTRALESREVIQGTLMRGTIHTVSAHDYWLMAAGIRAPRREWYERVTAKERGELRVDDLAQAVREILADGPHRQKEIELALVARGLPPRAFGWAQVAVDLVRVPPSGTWERRRADLYGLSEQWLDNRGRPSEEEGLSLLLARYLGAFGPARIHDFADWAGVTLPRARQTAATTELVTFRDEHGRDLIDLPEAPLPPENVPAAVRFLPTWDATLLVHARRTQILPEQYRTRIFHIRMPQSIGTFLVDGQVAGTWRWEVAATRVVAQPFEPLNSATQREVDREADALTEFHK